MNLSPNDDEWMTHVHPQLRGLARRLLFPYRDIASMQSADLVHEAWLNIKSLEGIWNTEADFIGYFVQTMRGCISDWARKRNAAKRGAGLRLEALDEALQVSLYRKAEYELAVGEALDQLRQVDPKAAEVIELRHYLRYTNIETAALLGLTVKQTEKKADWAKAWLRREIQKKKDN